MATAGFGAVWICSALGPVEGYAEKQETRLVKRKMGGRTGNRIRGQWGETRHGKRTPVREVGKKDG